jgi:hydroxyacylglutathione hydrolase
MDKSQIIQLHVGFSSPVVIQSGDHSVLIDTGVHGKMPEMLRQFKLFGIKPENIKLIILTHVHYDHAGNLEELKTLTGAKVVVNQREADYLRRGLMPIPRGTNVFFKIIVGLGDMLMPGYACPRPFEADILVDERMDLRPWGLDATIIHTPGHTIGSQSVLAGDALIAGDCFFNIRRRMVFPPFADDEVKLLETWRKLFEMGVKTIYPGHGLKFSVEKAKETYWKKTGRI